MSNAWKLIRWPYDVVVTFICYVYFALCGLSLTVVGPIADRLSKSRANRLAGRSAVGVAFRSFLGLWRASGLISVDLRVLDSLRHEPGLMIAPNHPSLLDAVVIMSRIPHVACIIKATLLHSPFIGGGARWSGHISNDAGCGIVRQAAAELQGGGQLLVFPEGTRTKPGADKVNPFKGGFALIAREAQAPVQTVILRQSCAFLGKGWPWWGIPVYPMTFRAELGRRFDPPPPNADVRVWLAELEAYFRSVL